MKRKNEYSIVVLMLVPLFFIVLNYMIFRVKINFIEILMVVIITFFSIYFYGEQQDYLNPAVYFPILYFLIYWLGDFSFGFYPDVPNELWIYYLIGIVGYYLGALAIDKIKIKVPSSIEKDYLSPDTRKIFLFIYILIIASKMVIYLKSGIPLLASNIDAARQSIGEDYSSLKVISAPYTILPVFFFYDAIVRNRDGLKIPKSDICVIICSFFFAILDVSRLLIIQMVIPMLFIYLIKVKRLKVKTIILSAILMILFIGGNKLVRNILDNPEYLASIQSTRDTNMLGNVFLSAFTSFRVGIDDFRQLINVVPASSNYTYGLMFMNSILSPLPGKQVVIGYYVAQLLGMNFDGIGAATTILGMFYLDGGPVLIFLGMFIFAFLTIFVYRKYIEYSNVSLYSLYAIYILYYVINTVRTNVMPTIEPLLFLFYYLIFGIIAKKVRFKK
ncbi:O-antigen polymerase [Lactobacillus equicursoris]|uniref:O-antigen polymerase n=1 Tax=Lactobacillus equicursoris TaxID=420645 RepID=UPI00399148C9